MTADFTRIAIVNRGEPAMRLLAATRELSLQRVREGRPPFVTIAFYTEPDSRAKFVREADETFLLGDALFTDASGARKSTYLNYDRLKEALLATRAEAAWVGWGFVAEHADFAQLCRDIGVVFVGPDPEVMRELGDKISSKRAAERAGVPVAPWSNGPVATIEEAREHAERIGYPLMVKATAGGGGRGIRKVRSPDQLEDAFTRARSEALAGFGDDTVFLERMVGSARHVEVQLLGDGQGTTWAVGVRDCSVQRRNQKVLEETPSPALTEEQDAQLRAAAVRLGDEVGYRNAGTVEFLYDTESKQFAFMEVNTRLQVEHPVTELVTGVDMVKYQLHIAAGGRLPEGGPPAPRGHAIEARVTAEAPERDFAPAPGLIERLRLPSGPGVRVDTGVDEGDEVAPQFDSMIAKVMAHGRDRDEAVTRLRRALSELELLLRDGASNKGFLLHILDTEAVRSGEVDIGWLDRLTEEGAHVTDRGAAVAIVEAACLAYEDRIDLAESRFYAAASRGRPEVPENLGTKFELSHENVTYELFVRRIDGERYAVSVLDEEHPQTLELERTPLGDKAVRIRCGGLSYRVFSTMQGAERVLEVDGIPHRVASEGGGTVRASAPGVVVALPVKEGQVVEAGQRIAVLEAMKTEMALVAPFAGIVKKVFVEPNVQVPAGAALMQLEPEAEDEATDADSERLSFALFLRPPVTDRAQRNLDTLESLLLGYEADPDPLMEAVQEEGTLTPDAAGPVWDRELRLLGIFADTSPLFRRTPFEDEEEVQSDTEYLYLYLRDVGGEAADLPEAFRARLLRALAHYGITDLEETPQLREALFRLFKSQSQVGQQVGPLQAILQGWLDRASELVDRADDGLLELVERLLVGTEGRFPGLNDLVREVRFRAFERPLLEQNRDQVFDLSTLDVSGLGESDEARRAEAIEKLVAIPQPLMEALGKRYGGATSAVRLGMAEVMARRFYRARKLSGPRRFVISDRTAVFTAAFVTESRRRVLYATHAASGRVGQVLEDLAEASEKAPPDAGVDIDVYVFGAAEQEPSIDLSILPDRVERIVFVFDHGPQGVTPVSYLRKEDGVFGIEELSPELHPMMAERLALQRLTPNFHLERLPAADGLFMFKGLSKTNPKDERLFVLSEVQDLTPVRDDQGRLVALPVFERQFYESLAAIRVVQAQRPARRRYEWNRIRLFIRPPIDLRPRELSRLAHKLGPATRGHGLERVEIIGRFAESDGRLVDRRLQISGGERGSLDIRTTEVPHDALEPLDRYTQKVVNLRRRGLAYPYDLVQRITSRTEGDEVFPPGSFVELDLEEGAEVDRLVPVDRPPGHNTANIVVGRIVHETAKHPEGMTRVIILGDPSRSMGSLAEAECRRISAAIRMAEEEELPVEWVAVSAGARISMETGTENMDWIGLVLRDLVRFTQAGGEVNILVAGINVGAQPYWNAEATMLQHTRGVLIQTETGAMVLTGKRALDYSGGISAEDDLGIGGFDRIMGPNGQAQYLAKDILDAFRILLAHYDHCYRAPGERFPRRAFTSDPHERDVRGFPHKGGVFQTVGEVFSEEHNPGRKKPFDIRSVMRAVTDQDHEPLPRWRAMRDAEVAVVWDAHLGGIPACMIGIESQPLRRRGPVPADGPEQWTGGTLFPQASKKVARALNASSGNRPAVILANLSGFDGSPESMRKLQLEYGAEIGRAVVNFDGPLVFCVVSRYHGGAFVVFSARLNENMEVAALEGTHASVIGGAPAAGVVFAREVQQRTERDRRVAERVEALALAEGAERVKLTAELEKVRRQVHSEMLGLVANEFDTVHSVQRALEVGSVHRILPPAELRPYLIDALERGMNKTLQG